MRQILIPFLTLFLLSCGNNKNPQNDESCIEKVQENCVCTMEYNPVCGCNGKTYSNACSAECHGIKKYTDGACN